MNTSKARTLHPGFMSPMRSAATAVLLLPTVERRATSCLFMLERLTASPSYKSMAPTPLRASASAHQPPTPPTSNSATFALYSFCMASPPKNACERANSSCIPIL